MAVLNLYQLAGQREWYTVCKKVLPFVWKGLC